MYPYIKFTDGRYQLHCGNCGRANARLEIVNTNILGQDTVQFVCSYCHNKRGEATPITGLGAIETMARRDSRGNQAIFEQMMEDIRADFQKQYKQLKGI